MRAPFNLLRESFTAVATDALGTVTTSAAVVSLTGPADGAQITSPDSFILTADAADADGSIAKVEFYNGATLLGTATTAPYSHTWIHVPVGNYSLTAIATDNLGGQTSSSAIGVTAIANVPPAVSLTGPANGTTATVPGSFTLTATATSSTSAVAKVDFYAIDNATNASTLIGTATQAPYTANWSNVPLGDYILSAVATDTLNAVTTSGPVTVTVNTGIARVYYIHADHLDTPRVITDTAGNIVWQWDNADPFGNNVPNENPAGAGTFSFNLRFPGQYADRETNTHYNINRDYDPATGRYVQSDPIGLDGGINTYTYVLGNPLSWVDPMGLANSGHWPRRQSNGFKEFWEDVKPKTCQSKCNTYVGLICGPVSAASGAETFGVAWWSTYTLCRQAVLFSCFAKCEIPDEPSSCSAKEK